MLYRVLWVQEVTQEAERPVARALPLQRSWCSELAQRSWQGQTEGLPAVSTGSSPVGSGAGGVGRVRRF